MMLVISRLAVTTMTQAPSHRLAREFLEKIESGQWPAGQRVPTTRVLAAEYGVSVNTIQTAFRVLESRNLVERRPRLGGFVKARPQRSSSLDGLLAATGATGTAATTIATTTIAVIVEQPE